jgi:hypothetical protein
MIQRNSACPARRDEAEALERSGIRGGLPHQFISSDSLQCMRCLEMCEEEVTWKITNEEWLKNEVKKVQSGSPLPFRCAMSTPERISLGLCLGDLPHDRIAHRQDTCSPDCKEAKSRLRREAIALRTCRFCGRGLTKSEREKLIQKGRQRAARPGNNYRNEERDTQA